MGSIRVRPETNTLFLDFRVNGRRVREHTTYADTAANRKRLRNVLTRIEAEISQGIYKPIRDQQVARPNPVRERVRSSDELEEAPLFKDFAEIWFAEKKVEWRRSYRTTQRGALDKYLIPEFGAVRINRIGKADLLGFRSKLTDVPGRASSKLSARRVNAVMKPLRQILNEAADRYAFATPFKKIKPLKTKRSDVQPFSLEEVQRILLSVREDFRPYLTVRLFTGLRTGEANALKWTNVDFNARLLLVRESLVLGEADDLKTDGSHRDVRMSQLVYDALRQQEKISGNSEYVFVNSVGKPLDNKNFVNRVWKPLLQQLNLPLRRPYQMRHTAATLWLAAGESPEWIARQLGHTTTEMLFRVYSRFIPNLTRQDGAAFDRLLIDTGLMIGPRVHL